MNSCLCKDCKFCDITRKKCFPKSKDCSSSYDLTEEDIYKVPQRCDFYEEQTDERH